MLELTRDTYPVTASAKQCRAELTGSQHAAGRPPVLPRGLDHRAGAGLPHVQDRAEAGGRAHTAPQVRPGAISSTYLK